MDRWARSFVDTDAGAECDALHRGLDDLLGSDGAVLCDRDSRERVGDRVFVRAGVNVSDSASPVSSYNTTVQIHHLWRIRFPSDFIGDVPCSWRMNKCAQSSKVHFPARSRNREGCPGRLNRNTYDTRFSRATRNAEQNCGSKKA